MGSNLTNLPTYMRTIFCIFKNQFRRTRSSLHCNQMPQFTVWETIAFGSVRTNLRNVEKNITHYYLAVNHFEVIPTIPTYAWLRDASRWTLEPTERHSATFFHLGFHPGITIHTWLKFFYSHESCHFYFCSKNHSYPFVLTTSSVS